MWQCQKVDSNGVRCTAKAVCRLQFSKDHPFDFFDVCEEHYGEYTDWLWKQYFEMPNTYKFIIEVMSELTSEEVRQKLIWSAMVNQKEINIIGLKEYKERKEDKDAIQK